MRGAVLASAGFSACGNEPASRQSCMSPQKKSGLCYILKSPEQLCLAIPQALVIALSHCFVTQRFSFVWVYWVLCGLQCRLKKKEVPSWLLRSILFLKKSFFGPCSCRNLFLPRVFFWPARPHFKLKDEDTWLLREYLKVVNNDCDIKKTCIPLF